MRIFEQLLSTIAPYQCLVCWEEGPLLCKRCQKTFSPPIARCYQCRNKASDALCGTCSKTSPLNSVVVATLFRDTAQQLVYKLKFDRVPEAAQIIAQVMAVQLQGDYDGVTNIPTATNRVRQRGYDQSALIARQLATLLNLPYIAVLGRLGRQRQLGQDRATRMTQLEQAYYKKCSLPVHVQNLLLIDDVITTGSSLETAAIVLKNAGAKQVHAAVFAAA